MAGIRVRANLPIEANPAMAGAIIPVPVESVWAWRSRGAIHGAPGTQAVPAPAPLPGLDRSPIAEQYAGYIGLPSSAVPQRWYPPVYYQTDWPEHAPVRYLGSSHELPVPARQAAGFIASRGVNTPGGINQFSPGAFLARLGGRHPIAQPTSIGTAYQ
jgi:hypothetical protein